MDRLRDICLKIAERRYEFSKHAVNRSIRRRIRVAEVEEVFRNECEVIEDYPEDKYGPSLLVLGITDAGRPLHVQVSYPDRPLLKIVTLYEPDASVWSNMRRRRRMEIIEGHERNDD